MLMKEHVALSVVSPVYKSEALVGPLVERIIAAVEPLQLRYEIILVEDAGPDHSWDRIVEHARKYPQVRGLRLSRNFGQQYALQAGLDASQGDWVVTLDCDLQDRPEEIPGLLRKAQEGFDVVAAHRGHRQDEWLKRFASRTFYRLLGYLTGTALDGGVANFMLYRRSVVDAMARFHDYHRYYPMLHKLVGFRYALVPIEHAERPQGRSSYSFRKRIRLALSTILSFSDKPLRLAVKLGVVLSALSLLTAIVLVVLYFASDVHVDGWASLALLQSFFSGAIITVLGMVGLYVASIFESVKERPTYLVSGRVNFDE